jgi:SAM-dependent methyltransferase
VTERCDVCGCDCRHGVVEWHYECPACGTEQSSLRPNINSPAVNVVPDEEGRVRGLAGIRREGYGRLLHELGRLRDAAGGTLLEIGSAYGWFLVSARDHFERAVGIEPDDAVRTSPDIPGIDVRAGYFPAAMRPGERFDVVAFNDVFEHIPDTHAVAAAVAAALVPRGIAVINLPVRHGGLYRLTKVLYRCGIRGPFERMWQRNFPSPHIYYFSRQGLRALFADVGLQCEHKIAMPTLRLAGLWPRIRHVEPRLPAAMGAYAGSVLIAPFIALLSSDVECFFFRKTDSAPDAP